MPITLVRHTQVAVPQGICYGQTDVPLAETFDAECAEIQRKLEGKCFTHCFSSPLSRCAQLAKRLFPGKIEWDERLKELNFGQWENRHWSDFEQSAEAQRWFADYLHMPCPSGESYAELRMRTEAFLVDLQKLPRQSNILIVTHGGPIRAMIAKIQNLDPKEIFDLKIEYGAVIELDKTTST